MKTFLKISAIMAFAPLPVFAEAHAPALPALVPQPNAEMVTFEHLDALNECDWDRLMAQYPEEVLFILPNGTTIEGRAAIGELFTGFCLSREEGGLAGGTFIPEVVRTVGDTVSVSWRLEADWLEEPYRGGDAYVTKDGLMYVQVTTFNPDDMNFKE